MKVKTCIIAKDNVSSLMCKEIIHMILMSTKAPEYKKFKLCNEHKSCNNHSVIWFMIHYRQTLGLSI